MPVPVSEIATLIYGPLARDGLSPAFSATFSAVISILPPWAWLAVH